MSWTTALLAGLAQHLDGLGLGTFRENSAYTKSETGIVIGPMPPGPDRVICLGGYSLTRPGGLATVAFMVQIAVRGPAGDSRGADAIGDPVCEALDGARGLLLGGVRVVQILHASGPAPLGLDANERPVRTDNHLITAERPTPLYPD